MFNLGAGEVLVIMLLALIVLGPQRLPDAARQIGKFMGEIRRMSSGFQHELKTAFDDETESKARERGAAATRTEARTATGVRTPAELAASEPSPPEPPAGSETQARPARTEPLRARSKHRIP